MMKPYTVPGCSARYCLRGGSTTLKQAPNGRKYCRSCYLNAMARQRREGRPAWPAWSYTYQ